MTCAPEATWDVDCSDCQCPLWVENGHPLLANFWGSMLSPWLPGSLRQGSQKLFWR